MPTRSRKTPKSNKAKRNHKKRHGMNRERSQFARAKAELHKRTQREARERRFRWREIMRLYWSGEAIDISTALAIIGGGYPEQRIRRKKS